MSERCGHCGGTKDKPGTMSDDSYSTFKCPFPFHRKAPKPDADMSQVTKKLGQSYRQWKESEKEKNRLRDEFFRVATEACQEETPAQVVEQVEAQDEEECLRSAQRRFPRHKVLDVREVSEGQWNVILEENPELKEFSYVNEEDGQVYQRIISEGAPSLDDEGLKEEQPGLWEAITQEVTRRELRPLEELTPEQQAALRPYLTMPKPQTRLGAPRRAKPEELEIENHD